MREREDYKKRLDAQMKEWEAEIRALQREAQRAAVEKIMSQYRLIRNLRVKRNVAAQILQRLGQAGENEQKALREALEDAMADLRDAISSARMKFVAAREGSYSECMDDAHPEQEIQEIADSLEPEFVR